MNKLRMRFSKTGRAIYISHLDLMATMQRAFSRAGSRLQYSEGFNPRPQISIALPLSVGTASLCELMDFRLIEEVDRPEFGTHLDVVNMITSPRRFFYNDEFLKECFSKLKGTIVSCHLKDIRLKEEYTFQLEECACGEGSLDLRFYSRLATEENPRMPMIIEHLDTDEEYEASVKYVKELLHC